MSLSVHIHRALHTIDAAAWNQLAGSTPFLRHEFLSALHDSASACTATGWQVLYLTLENAGQLLAAAPLYLKTHSYGEYVFDQAWAVAFYRHGLSYYPKLLCAVPFTPISGPRLLAQNAGDRALLAEAMIELAREYQVSSLHVNFIGTDDAAALRSAGFLLRQGVQFHWQNQNYADFDAFLASMTHDKRKKIRQDLRRVDEAGVRFQHVRGADISSEQMDFFYRCYCNTYREHGSSPYLQRTFFEYLQRDMGEHLLLVLALRDEIPVACAFNIIGGPVLYGRYWGSTEFVSGLHFATCYLQAIAYCIAHGLQCFEGGAQGEHKMARGLLATPTWSAHWIADPRFATAIADFLDRETVDMTHYRQELEAHTPFKRER